MWHVSGGGAATLGLEVFFWSRLLLLRSMISLVVLVLRISLPSVVQVPLTKRCSRQSSHVQHLNHTRGDNFDGKSSQVSAFFFSFFNSLITAWKTFCLFNLRSNFHCRSRETTSPFDTDHHRKFFTPKNLCVTCMCVESTDQPQKGFHFARFLLLNYLHCTHQPTFNNRQLHHQPVGRFPMIC